MTSLLPKPILYTILLLSTCFSMKMEDSIHVKQLQPELAVNLNLCSKQYDPSLIFENGSSSFGFQNSGQELVVGAGDLKVMTLTEQEVDTKELLYLTEDPIISKNINTYGLPNWKLLESQYFSEYPSNLISRCQNTVILGGPCKLSNVRYPPYKGEFVY